MRVLAKAILMLLIIHNTSAESISSLVEFFSFRCSHCANVNQRLSYYVNSHDVQFLDVNVDGDAALPTMIMYYVAVDAGIGNQFKTAYFSAVANGMPVYDQSTLNYVYNQVKTPKLVSLLKSSDEKAAVKNKLLQANKLLATYHIQATPTFLINHSILLEGEDIINTLQ